MISDKLSVSTQRFLFVDYVESRHRISNHEYSLVIMITKAVISPLQQVMSFLQLVANLLLKCKAVRFRVIGYGLVLGSIRLDENHEGKCFITS